MNGLFGWWRRRHEDNDEDAQAALEAAREALEAAQRVEPVIQQVGEELRRLQRTNHFSPMVQEAIRRHKEAS